MICFSLGAVSPTPFSLRSWEKGISSDTTFLLCSCTFATRVCHTIADLICTLCTSHAQHYYDHARPTCGRSCRANDVMCTWAMHALKVVHLGSLVKTHSENIEFFPFHVQTLAKIASCGLPANPTNNQFKRSTTSIVYLQAKPELGIGRVGFCTFCTWDQDRENVYDIYDRMHRTHFEESREHTYILLPRNPTLSGIFWHKFYSLGYLWGSGG